MGGGVGGALQDRWGPSEAPWGPGHPGAQLRTHVHLSPWELGKAGGGHCPRRPVPPPWQRCLLPWPVTLVCPSSP